MFIGLPSSAEGLRPNCPRSYQPEPERQSGDARSRRAHGRSSCFPLPLPRSSLRGGTTTDVSDTIVPSAPSQRTTAASGPSSGLKTAMRPSRPSDDVRRWSARTSRARRARPAADRPGLAFRPRRLRPDDDQGAPLGLDLQRPRDLDPAEECPEDVFDAARFARPEAKSRRLRVRVVSIPLEESQTHGHRGIARVEDRRVSREGRSCARHRATGRRQIQAFGRARRRNLDAVPRAQIRHHGAYVGNRRTRRSPRSRARARLPRLPGRAPTGSSGPRRQPESRGARTPMRLPSADRRRAATDSGRAARSPLASSRTSKASVCARPARNDEPESTSAERPVPCVGAGAQCERRRGSVRGFDTERSVFGESREDVGHLARLERFEAETQRTRRSPRERGEREHGVDLPRLEILDGEIRRGAGRSAGALDQTAEAVVTEAVRTPVLMTGRDGMRSCAHVASTACSRAAIGAALTTVCFGVRVRVGVPCDLVGVGVASALESRCRRRAARLGDSEWGPAWRVGSIRSKRASRSRSASDRAPWPSASGSPSAERASRSSSGSPWSYGVGVAVGGLAVGVRPCRRRRSAGCGRARRLARGVGGTGVEVRVGVRVVREVRPRRGRRAGSRRRRRRRLRGRRLRRRPRCASAGRTSRCASPCASPSASPSGGTDVAVRVGVRVAVGGRRSACA